jgi:group I intron endonuclease
MDSIYIYTLSDPITNQIRYVGKTQNLNERFRSHVNAKKSNKHKVNWINKLKNNGFLPVIEVLDVVSRDSWELAEKYWIQQMKAWGFNLLNATDGGGGIDSFSHSEESKTKISQASKKMWSNSDFKKKASVKLLGNSNPFADKQVYHFWHEQHGDIKCTQSELRRKFNLGCHTSQLINRQYLSYKGWRLHERRSELYPLCDKEKYTFTHDVNGERNCTRKELLLEFPNLRREAICKLVNGNMQSHLGWAIAKP